MTNIDNMSANDVSEDQLNVIFYHGAYPLWVYLQEVIGINIVDVCARVTKDEPILESVNGKLVCRVVDLPYPRKLGNMFNNDVIFLLNSINVVFESLKAGVEKDGTQLMAQFKFKLDADNNIFLVGAESNEPIANRAIAVMALEE